MRVTLYKTNLFRKLRPGDKRLEYDTKHKLYVILFKIDSIHGNGLRYTVANTFNKAINLIKNGYQAG